MEVIAERDLKSLEHEEEQSHNLLCREPLDRRNDFKQLLDSQNCMTLI